MATTNLPFAASATKRAPDADELANGYGCGDADLQLFDWLAWWLTGQLAGAIDAGGQTVDDTDLLRLAKVIQSGKSTYAAATGSANAWTVAPTLAVPAYAAGRVLNIIAPATNTSTTVNMNVSGLGNRRIKKADGTDPAIGDLISGRVYATIDDGTNIRVLTTLPSEFSLTLAASHGSTGYQQLVGGLYLQWGLVDPVAAAALTAVTFPIAFPTAAYQVVITDRSDVVGNTDQVSVRTTGFPPGSPS
ncbi:hypothetical protein [Bosea sp. UC22_33]|uniref:gp53-like domain-containing protein n=1 Tax=Bosea sp. UC22_33 TaxID=3350165 RepID=UPI00366B1B04